MTIVLPGADSDGMVQVRLPSGAVFPVHKEEVDYFQERVALYLDQNHFGNISDLSDVDRMMVGELLCFRWATWISRNRDYWGDAVDLNELQKQMKEWNTELRQLKKMLGIDKVARDKVKGDDSVAAYLQNLLIRAREFGVMRERQLDVALELMQQLFSLLTLHDNTDEIEKREMHVTTEDLLEWLREVARPEYQAVDAYFREHQQSLWIRKM